MNRRRLLLVAILASPAVAVILAADAASALRQASAIASLEAQADVVVAAAMKDQNIPAVSIAIARAGRSLVAKG